MFTKLYTKISHWEHGQKRVSKKGVKSSRFLRTYNVAETIVNIFETLLPFSP